MDDTENTEPEKNPGQPLKTEHPPSTGDEAQAVRAVEVTIRITPLSLLWSSLIGTVALGILLLAGAWALPVPLFSVGSSPSGAIFSLSSGLWLPPTFAALLLALFATGYRRHGRPAPTEAWIQDAALAVKVPTAWGKLFREALCLEDPHFEESHRKDRTGPGPSSPLHSTEPTGTGVVVTGPAQEWWDPGTYEVHVPPPEAEILRATLTNEAEEMPNQ